MKITYKREKNEEKRYPYFGIFDVGLIVLFTSANSGSVVNVGSSVHRLGETRKNWTEYDAEPFYGTITIAKD